MAGCADFEPEVVVFSDTSIGKITAVIRQISGSYPEGPYVAFVVTTKDGEVHTETLDQALAYLGIAEFTEEGY